MTQDHYLPTPPLTRQGAREARRTLAEVEYRALPDGRLQATFEVHGLIVTETIHPDRRNHQ